MLVSCASGDDGFAGSQGGSSTNIISDKNFQVFIDPTNPAVVDDDGGHGGVEVTISVTAADRNNAKVSGGTVYIKTQWGVLENPSCQLINGTCSVKWTSDSDFSFIPSDLYNTVTVYTRGEESYTDLNGSGTFDDNDLWLRDVSEPFIDLDHDGVYTASADQVIDIDGNGILTPADGAFNGAGCSHTTLCPQGTPTIITLFDTTYMDMYTGTTATPALSVTIDTPNNLDSFTSGTNITFTAIALDPEDGTIQGANNPLVGDNIVWSSDLDGTFGTQNTTTSTNTLSVGDHIITVTVTDSNANTATASIAITITP